MTHRGIHYACWLETRAWAQAKGDAAVRAAFPSATIFKPATLIGGEDRFTNNIAQMGKKCALARQLRSQVPSSLHLQWSSLCTQACMYLDHFGRCGQ